jgi:hypothetical protein
MNTDNIKQEATTKELNEYIIYEIRPFNRDLIYSYVGSTKNFRSRKSQHKTVCNNENSKGYNLNLYQFIRGNGGWFEFEMIEKKLYKCKTKTEAHIREQHFIDMNENKKINMKRAYNTEEKNKDAKLEYNKKY